MNIGSLYAVKQWFWLLFPTKETATAAAAEATAPADPYFTTDASTDAYADYWSKQYNCEVNYFSPETLIVFLEEDGKYKKFLTSDGRIGWTWVHEKYIHCFEEANP